MIEKPKILATRTLHNGWLKLKQADILLPNNTEMTYTFAEKEDGVIVLPLTKDKQVVMVEQFRVPIKKVFLELPAGLREPGETPEETAARELEEETGYKPGKLVHLTTVYPTTGLINFKAHLFFATELKKTKQNLEESEFLEVRLIPLKQFERMVKEGYMEGSMALAYFYAKSKKLI
ncbi:NUDIX hydrolase [Candidatus Woesearchaeota archaeon]|nr:NUDIX hydrolase [Candidatus Woesearchaeota archaeon]RLE42060.1 MAG: NUDIX hydrolase [Candidatus Woesearchaeota archaeon]